jgi:hypothetical protein
MIGANISYSLPVLRTLHDMTKLMDVTGTHKQSLLEQYQQQNQAQSMFGTLNTLASFSGQDPNQVLQGMGINPSALNTSGLLGNPNLAGGNTTTTPPAKPAATPAPANTTAPAKGLPKFGTWDAFMNWFDSSPTTATSKPSTAPTAPVFNQNFTGFSLGDILGSNTPGGGLLALDPSLKSLLA